MRKILSQKSQREAAKPQRREENLLKIFAPLRLCVFAFLLFFVSCASKPTDLRALAPAETLVYLETRDLAKTLYAVTENEAFRETAKDKPDFSRLENVQLAVAVTGFEASENKVTEENSILNFKPHFVAIVDTHAWKPTAVSMTQNQIGSFVKEIYGDDVTLERDEKRDAQLFTWTSADGRKLFAGVAHSIIYLANDETLLDKCLAIERGEADNALKNESLSRAYAANSENAIAFGYVSPEGIAQIANLAGVSVASEAAEEAEGQSFIARVLPQILQGAAREIVWTAQKNGERFEDKLSISLNAETTSVFKETLAQNAEARAGSAEFLPPNFFSTTRYNLKNPQVAWRGLLFVAAKNTDAASGKLIVQFSNEILGSYGISDAETFLSAVDSEIFTTQFDAEGEKGVTIATVKDAEKIKRSVSGEIDFKAQPEKLANAEVWYSKDKKTAAAFAENFLVLGETESVLKCLEAKSSGQNFAKNPVFQKFADSKAAAITFARDADSARKIVEILGEIKDENKIFITDYLTETRITEKGIERKSVSSFGLIGSIIERLKE